MTSILTLRKRGENIDVVTPIIRFLSILMSLDKKNITFMLLYY